MSRLPSFLIVLLALVVSAGSVVMETPLCPTARAGTSAPSAAPPCHDERVPAVPSATGADAPAHHDGSGAPNAAPPTACCVLCAPRALIVAASAPAARATPAVHTSPNVAVPPAPLHEPATPPPRGTPA